MNNQNLPKVAQNSPYMVQIEAGKQYSWCACGLSSKQPFCDGSHKDTGMKSVKYLATESKMVAFCGCKKTAGVPFCDGTHGKG